MRHAMVAMFGSWALCRVTGVSPARGRVPPTKSSSPAPTDASPPHGPVEVESMIDGALLPLAQVGQRVRAGEQVARVGGKPLQTPVTGEVVEWLAPIGHPVRRE